MATTQAIVINSLAEDGRRRVCVDDRFAGLAYGLPVLRLAGLDDDDDVWVQQSLPDRVAWGWPGGMS
ncbi:hypothetical protein ACGFXB_27550 [Streptomyces canus]|uniref:hypothetical protein n=1 Tax=Streptomyces canus TaxID=58343 RepID=UPI0037228133